MGNKAYIKLTGSLSPIKKKDKPMYETVVHVLLFESHKSENQEQKRTKTETTVSGLKGLLNRYLAMQIV